MSDEELPDGLAEDRPREVLAAIDDRLDGEPITRDRLITHVVAVAREEGFNLARLIYEHPWATEEILARSIQFDQHAVDLVDDALDGRLDEYLEDSSAE